MSDADVNFDTLILCDDIRAEKSGKLILIGVYPTDIGSPQFPATFGFSVHTQGDVVTPGKVDIRFAVEDESGSVLFRSDDLHPIVPPGTEFILGRFVANFFAAFTANKESTIHFVANVSGNRHILGKRKITVNQTPGTI